jgi:hypothetical protein
MLSNISKIEIKVGEKVYQLLCDLDSPIEHVKEAIFQFGKFVGQIEDNIKLAQTQIKSELPDAVTTPPVIDSQSPDIKSEIENGH